MTGTTTPAVGVASNLRRNRRGASPAAARGERTAEMTAPATFARHATGVRSLRLQDQGPHVPKSLDSFNCRRTISVGSAEYAYFSLLEAEKNGLTGIAQ